MANINKAVSLKKNAERTASVGDAEDMIPFAWRQPLCVQENKKMSRVFRNMHAAETERAMLMPSIRTTDDE